MEKFKGPAWMAFQAACENLQQVQQMAASAIAIAERDMMAMRPAAYAEIGESQLLQTIIELEKA